MFRKTIYFVLGSMISSAALNAADALREVASQGKPSVVKSALVGGAVGFVVRCGLQLYQHKNTLSKVQSNDNIDGQRLWNDVKALAHHPKDLWYTPESVWSDFKTLSADLKKWGQQNLNTVIIPVLSGIVTGTVCHAVQKRFFWNALYEAAKEYVGSKTYEKHALQNKEDFLCAALCKGAEEGNADLVGVLSKIKNYPIETSDLSSLVTAFKKHWIVTGLQTACFNTTKKENFKKCCESLIANCWENFSQNSQEMALQINYDVFMSTILDNLDNRRFDKILKKLSDHLPCRLKIETCKKILEVFMERRRQEPRKYSHKFWLLTYLGEVVKQILRTSNGEYTWQDVVQDYYNRRDREGIKILQIWKKKAWEKWYVNIV